MEIMNVQEIKSIIRQSEYQIDELKHDISGLQRLVEQQQETIRHYQWFQDCIQNEQRSNLAKKTNVENCVQHIKLCSHYVNLMNSELQGIKNINKENALDKIYQTMNNEMHANIDKISEFQNAIYTLEGKISNLYYKLRQVEYNG